MTSFSQTHCPSLCLLITASQWLKCKIRGGRTLHSCLGPWQWSRAFPNFI